MTYKRPERNGIIKKLPQIEVLMGQGMSRLDVVSQIGVAEQNYYP